MEETFSYIEITFTEDLIASDAISFDYGSIDGTLEFSEVFAPVRYQFGIAQVPTDAQITDIPGEATAINFVNAFNSDYNVANSFEVTRDGNLVTIKSYEYGLDFSNIVTPLTTGTGTGTGTLPFAIGTVTFTAGTNCSNLTVNIQTSQLADEILSPIQQMPVTNPITFVYERNVSFEAHVRKGAIHKYRVVGMPAGINPSSITLNINDNPAGSSVEILVFAYLLEFTYSLDGITYQSSNIFSNVLGGVYTAYVKDQFGCITEKEFELDGFGINSPFFNIPESNSIRFANRVTWGDCGNYKNDFNTLSCETDVPIPYKEILQFQACDVITTQFKSNFAINSVEVAGGEFPVTNKTDFMRRKDRRDAILCNLGDGSSRTGIYFIEGNLYNYDTGVDIGDYTLNGALPEWGKAGNFVKHPNGNWYLIEDVYYLESRSADVLVIDTGLVPVTDVPGIVSSFYNFQNYEVYEFTIDFASYIGQKLQVRIFADDPYFDEVEFLSEVIEVKTRHIHTVQIQYSNDTNTDVYYATGILHKIRIPLEKAYGAPIDETETYNTDTGTILLSTDVRKSRIYEFGDVTQQMMWKVIIALSHKNVTIDGVGVVKQSIEVTGPLEQTNLYSIKATMIESNSAYRGNGLLFDETGMEIPALIPTGTGFVKYQ